MIDLSKKYKTIKHNVSAVYIGESRKSETFKHIFEILGARPMLAYFDDRGYCAISADYNIRECKPFDGWDEDDRLVLRNVNGDHYKQHAHYSINGCVWSDGKTSHTSSACESLIGCYSGWIVSNLDKGESVQL